MEITMAEIQRKVGEQQMTIWALQAQVTTLQGMLAEPENIGQVAPTPINREHDEAG